MIKIYYASAFRAIVSINNTFVIEQCNYNNLNEVAFYAWPDTQSSDDANTVAIFKVKKKGGAA